MVPVAIAPAQAASMASRPGGAAASSSAAEAAAGPPPSPPTVPRRLSDLYDSGDYIELRHSAPAEYVQPRQHAQGNRSRPKTMPASYRAEPFCDRSKSPSFGSDSDDVPGSRSPSGLVAVCAPHSATITQPPGECCAELRAENLELRRLVRTLQARNEELEEAAQCDCTRAVSVNAAKEQRSRLLLATWLGSNLAAQFLRIVLRTWQGVAAALREEICGEDRPRLMDHSSVASNITGKHEAVEQRMQQERLANAERAELRARVAADELTEMQHELCEMEFECLQMRGQSARDTEAVSEAHKLLQLGTEKFLQLREERNLLKDEYLQVCEDYHVNIENITVREALRHAEAEETAIDALRAECAQLEAVKNQSEVRHERATLAAFVEAANFEAECDAQRLEVQEEALQNERLRLRCEMLLEHAQDSLHAERDAFRLVEGLDYHCAQLEKGERDRQLDSARRHVHACKGEYPASLPLLPHRAVSPADSELELNGQAQMLWQKWLRR